VTSYPTSLTLVRLRDGEATYADDKSGTRLVATWSVFTPDKRDPAIYIDRIMSVTPKGRTWYLAPQGRTWGRVDKALHQDVRTMCRGIRALALR
jgi:hypothetical protein